MKRKLLAMLLMLAMTTALLAGCGSTGAETASEAAAYDPDENLELSIWLYKDDYKLYDSYDENPVVQYLNDKFNCTLKFQQPAMGSEQEQFSLMLGTGSYTDAMEISYCQESVVSLYEDGVIRDIAPYVETYMPNFYAFLNKEENADVKSALYDSEGHLFTIPFQLRTKDETRWGGLVYRQDIIDTMTGGYVFYPSGNDKPITIEDWEYMLDLYQQYFAYFDSETACLILPACGYFVSGELLTGFGAAPDFYVDNGTVIYGPTQTAFYNYLVKMHEWYEKGYIYKDFASRTNDVFYLPNTALTYGASAGMWFGLASQLGDAMSMPEYSLFTEVQAIASPLDTANGVTEQLAVTALENERVSMETQGYVISASCEENKLIRFLSVCDYLFTEEGAMLRSYGLTAEQGAADNSYYAAKGLEGGAYTMTDGTFTYAEQLVPGIGEYSQDGSSVAFVGQRLPGILENTYQLMYESEINLEASVIWKGTGIENNYPSSVVFSAEDNDIKSSNYSSYSDYLDSMVPKFIMGTEPLTEESFAAFVAEMNRLGVEESTAIYQSYYDAYAK